MRLLAIDPGNQKSAWMVLEDGVPLENGFGIFTNTGLKLDIRDKVQRFDHIAIETLKPRGMPTSFEEMQTQFWAGRFVEAAGVPFTQCFRHDIKMHHCGRATAKDTNIRRAMIDRFGGDEKAIGGIKCHRCGGKGWRGVGRPVCDFCEGRKWFAPPGPLHDVHDDLWSALAIGTYWFDTKSASVMEVESVSAT